MFVCKNVLCLSHPKWLQKLRIIFFAFFFIIIIISCVHVNLDSKCWRFKCAFSSGLCPLLAPHRSQGTQAQLRAVASSADPLGEPAVGWCCQVHCHNTGILEEFPYSPLRIDQYFIGITKYWGDWSAFKLFWYFFSCFGLSLSQGLEQQGCFLYVNMKYLWKTMALN